MIEDPLEFKVQLDNAVLKDPKVLLERLVKWDLLEHATREALVVLVSSSMGPRGSQGAAGKIGPKGDRQ